MIAVAQRVEWARVEVAGEEISAIGRGLLVLLGVVKQDGPEEADYLAGKIANLRVFDNGEGKFDRSLLDTGGEALVVSQFTLAAQWRKGRRPGFDNAMPPEKARPLVERFTSNLAGRGVGVREGRFGAHMKVSLANDGPVTLVMDTQARE